MRHEMNLFTSSITLVNGLADTLEDLELHDGVEFKMLVNEMRQY